jgi:ribosomal protein S27AE
MNTVGNIKYLHNQGTCKHCGIALYSHKNERRYVCGHCEIKHDNTGRFARKVQDYVVKAKPISEKRKLHLLETQVDDLKREVAYWKDKANAR